MSMKYGGSAVSSLGFLWMTCASFELLPPQVASADVQLFTTETGVNNTNLAEVNWHTGVVISQFPQHNGFIVDDLAYDPSTDRMFGYAPNSGLYSINRSTGAFSLIAGGALNIRGLAIQPTTFALYGISLSGTLFNLNKTTGAATVIGSDSDFGTVHGLAFDALGKLYASDTTGAGTSGLFIVDPETGSAVHTATIDRDFVIGLSFHPDGTLYGTDNGTKTLITIDTDTGFATTVGSFGNTM